MKLILGFCVTLIKRHTKRESAMLLQRLEHEINNLRMVLYDLGKEVDDYSSGKILLLSKRLDEKIILYQKLKDCKRNHGSPI